VGAIAGDAGSEFPATKSVLWIANRVELSAPDKGSPRSAVRTKEFELLLETEPVFRLAEAPDPADAASDGESAPAEAAPDSLTRFALVANKGSSSFGAAPKAPSFAGASVSGTGDRLSPPVDPVLAAAFDGSAIAFPCGAATANGADLPGVPATAPFWFMSAE
jgi:hypothetical protein